MPQWSPDGKTIAAKIPLRNGMEGQLGLIDVATGDVTRVGPEHGTVGVWAWSPDGSAILFAGDTEQTWQYDLFLYDVASETIERLTDDLARAARFRVPDGVAADSSRSGWTRKPCCFQHSGAERAGSTGSISRRGRWSSRRISEQCTAA